MPEIASDWSMRGACVQTELCATFSRVGSCPYGHKCQFAHGVDELRVRQVRQQWREGGAISDSVVCPCPALP